MILPAQISGAADFVRSRTTGFRPKVGFVMGSGLSAVADRLQGGVAIAYSDIPHFPTPLVAGHSGRLHCGAWAGVPALVLQGRVHYYEGHDLEVATLPIRVLAALGIETLVVTNAAGSLRKEYRPGTLMAIRDHLNLMGTSPLRGPHDESFGTRFVDLTEAYDERLRAALRRASKRLRIPLREGVYAAMPGPQYETPAEVKMLRRLGADAAGMSTVPEVIVARQAGVRCVALSCLTNLAAGLAPGSVDHADVLAVGRAVQDQIGRLLEGFLQEVYDTGKTKAATRPPKPEGRRWKARR